MKILKLFTLSCCLSAINFSVAADYETIYSCGFEEGDDLSNWNLVNADDYIEIEDNSQNLFYIGATTSYESSKSLYVSQDNGESTDIYLGAFHNTASAYAELNLTLPAGDYLMSFNYKCKSPQDLSIVFCGERLDLSTIHYIEYVALTDDWTTETIPFSLDEAANTIIFAYSFNTSLPNAGKTVEGLAIDNIEIKREKNETGASVNQTLLPEIKVYSIDRSIVVENATGAVTVYNTTGQVVAQGAGREFAVPQAGVYVVKAGETVKKVVIR